MAARGGRVRIRYPLGGKLEDEAVHLEEVKVAHCPCFLPVPAELAEEVSCSDPFFDCKDCKQFGCESGDEHISKLATDEMSLGVFGRDV